MRELEDSWRCDNPESWLSRLLTGKGQRSSLRAHYKHRECNVNPRPQLLNLLLTGPISSCHCSCLIHEGRDQGWGTFLILEMETIPSLGKCGVMLLLLGIVGYQNTLSAHLIWSIGPTRGGGGQKNTDDSGDK